MIKILLALLLANTLWGAYTRDNTTQTIYDSQTNLTWQDDVNVSSQTKTWSNAIDYCENLNFAGQTDWRLPNNNELSSIVDYGRTNLSIDPTFQNVTSYFYWSSTTYAGDSSYAWNVIFCDGFDYLSVKSGSFYVRCVRGGQLVPSSLLPTTFTNNLELISAMESGDGNITTLNLSSTLSSTLSRSEAVYLLDAVLRLSVPTWEIDVSEYPLTFGDVDEESAYAKGLKRLSYYLGSDDKTVITKENALFNPLRPTSRQEFIAMVFQGFNLSYASSTQSLSAFSDTADIVDWAIPYFKYAVEHGIIVGNAGNLFPSQSITRDEALNILRKTLGTINGNYVHNANGYGVVGETIGLAKEINDVVLDASMPDMTATPIVMNPIIEGSGTVRRTLAATFTADTAKGATPYCDWYTDWGYLEKSTSVNNASVYFHPSRTRPDEDYTVTAQCYDGLGFYDEKVVTIFRDDFTYSSVESGGLLLVEAWPTELYANRETILPVVAHAEKDGLSLGVEYVKVWLSDGAITRIIFEGRPSSDKILFVTPDIPEWYGNAVTMNINAQFHNGRINSIFKSVNIKPDYRINGQVIVREREASVNNVIIDSKIVAIDIMGYFSAELDNAGIYTVSVGDNNASIGFQAKSITLTQSNPTSGVILVQDDMPDVNWTYAPTTQRSGAILSPAGGTTFTSGISTTFTWDASQLSGNAVNLYVSQNDLAGLILDNTILTQKNWYLFADNLSNTGSFTFDPTIFNNSGSAFKILAVTNTGNWSVNSGTFSTATGGGGCVAPTGTPPAISKTDVIPSAISVRKDNDYFYFNIDYTNFPEEYIQLVRDSGASLFFDEPLLKNLQMRIWYSNNCQYRTVFFYTDNNGTVTSAYPAGDAELTTTGVRGKVLLSTLANHNINLPSTYAGHISYYFYFGNGEESNFIKYKTPISISADYEELKQIIQMQNGWNLATSFESFNPSAISDDPLLEIIWHYKNGLWYAISPMNSQIQQKLDTALIPKLEGLQVGDGFWIRLSSDGDTFTKIPFDITTNTKLIEASTGWTMLGAGRATTPANIRNAKSNIQTIWTYRDNEWYLDANGVLPSGIKKLETLNAGEGFWIYVK